MKKYLLSILIILSLLTKTYGQDSIKYNFNFKYGILLKKIVPDFKAGTFYAEFYWWTTFNNDSSISGYTNEDIMNLQYVNGSETANDAIQSEIQEMRYLSDNKIYYTGYHQGNFFFNPEFANYPFDKQILNIEIEHTLLLEYEISIQPDIESFKFSKMNGNLYGISNDLLNNATTSMKIYKTDINSGVCVYNSNFGDPDFPAESKYSRLTFAVYLERNVTPYITKFFIPLGIILFLVYFVFFIPADKLDMAAGLTVTSLLSAIAFQFTINSDLPEIGYMIYVDKVFYLTYILIVLAMGESLLTFYLDMAEDERKKKLAVKIDVYSRFLFPLIFLIFSYYFKD